MDVSDCTLQVVLLDLVISSVPDQVNVTEVMEPNEAEMFTDHCIVSFELASAVKSPPKLQRFVYDYARADLDRLRSSLQALNLSNAISTRDRDIERDWHSWKDTLVSAADYIPKKGKESSTLDNRAYSNSDKEKGIHA